jgi:hypothetical protein
MIVSSSNVGITNQYSTVLASCQKKRLGSNINMFSVKNIRSINSQLKRENGMMNQYFQIGPDNKVMIEKIITSQKSVCCEYEYAIN